MNHDLFIASQQLLREKLKNILTDPTDLNERTEKLTSCWLNKWDCESKFLTDKTISDWLTNIAVFLENFLKKRRDVLLNNRTNNDDNASAPQRTEYQERKLNNRFKEKAIDRLLFIEKQWAKDKVYFQNKLLEYIWIVAHKYIPDKDLKAILYSKKYFSTDISQLKEIFKEFEYRFYIYNYFRDKNLICGRKEINCFEIFTKKVKTDEEWLCYLSDKGKIGSSKVPSANNGDFIPAKVSYAKHLFFSFLDRVFQNGKKGWLNFLFRRMLLPLKLLQEFNGYLNTIVKENRFLPDGERIKTFRRDKIVLILNLFKCTKKRMTILIKRCLLEFYFKELVGLLVSKEGIKISRETDFFNKKNWNLEEFRAYLSEFYRTLWLYCHIRDNQERIESEETSTKLIWEHMSRYDFIASYLEPDNIVLDAGCGIGLGLAHLAQHVKKIIGFDKYINFSYGKNLITFNNVHLMAMDINNLAFKEAQFDAIFLFELIEHLIKPQKNILKLMKLLKEDGLFVVSTPNKDFFSQDMNYPWNPYHIKEYTLDEFKQFLNKFFIEVKIYGQHFNPKILNNEYIDDNNRDFFFCFEPYKKEDFFFTEKHLNSSMNFIALCKGKKNCIYK